VTPKRFYEQIATFQDKELITLAPGPLVMVAAPVDAWPAKLLLWLHEKLPEETTQGDLEDILDMALWWARFWHMCHQGEKLRAAQQETTQEAMGL